MVFLQGYACGIMTAQNVPHRREPIVTFFEADVIDNIHHTFYTGSKYVHGAVLVVSREGRTHSKGLHVVAMQF